ncbi:MAG: oligosaccharide flippase family protein [Hyphomonadaceae bacterium]|nr:oligosaccharide flippase family protein [Hyphomonadaceae bacterium]
MADRPLNLRKVWDSLPRPKTDIGRRLASGSFWSLVGEAGGRAFSFVSTILVARWLGIEDYGAFALAQSTLLTVSAFAAFGLGLTSSRYIAAFRDSDPAQVESVNGIALTFSTVSGALCALAIFFAAPYLASEILRHPDLAVPLQIIAPTLFLYTVGSALGGVIIGFEAFRKQTWITFVTGVVGFAALVAGALLWGLNGALFGLLATEVFRCAATFIVARRLMRARGLRILHPGRASDAKVLWQFSLPVFLGATQRAVIVWICQAIIVRQAGVDQIGLYDAAQKWMTLVLLAPMAASASFSPVLSNLSEAGDGAAAHRRTTRQLALIQLAATAAPALVLALAAPLIVGLSFGEAYAAAAPVIVVMMFTAPFIVLNNLYWRAYVSTGNAWTVFNLGSVWAVIALALTWLWRADGAMGMALAQLIGQIAVCAVFAVAMELVWRREARATPAAAQA